jgi:hypothetical protein
MDNITALVCAILNNQVLLSPHVKVIEGPLNAAGQRQVTASIDLEGVIAQAINLDLKIRVAEVKLERGN